MRLKTAASASLLLPALLLYLPSAAAHPGENLDVKIEIRDEGVTQRILVSADLIRTLFTSYEAEYQVPQRIQDEYRYTEPDAQAHFRQTLADIFELENPVTINDQPITPELRQAGFIQADSLGYVADLPPDVQVTLFYPAPNQPREVALVWTIYPADAARRAMGMPAEADVIAELDTPDENRLLKFRPDEPEHIWHAPTPTTRDTVSPVVAALNQPILKIPALSVGIVAAWSFLLAAVAARRGLSRFPRPLLIASVLPLAVAALSYNFIVLTLPAPWAPTIDLPPATEAVSIFQTLHQNVYRAFEKKTPNDIYDVLAYSVDGNLLDEVYNEVHQSLIMRDQGGAVARIRAVDILDAQLQDAGVLAETQAAAFTVRSRWRVHGAVYHWGHVHSRTNEYTARFTVTQRAGNWKITGISDLEGERIVQEGDDPQISRYRSGPINAPPPPPRRNQLRSAAPPTGPSTTNRPTPQP